MYTQGFSVIKVKGKKFQAGRNGCQCHILLNSHERLVPRRQHRPDNFLINDLKIAFLMVEQEWGVGQKLDGEEW